MARAQPNPGDVLQRAVVLPVGKIRLDKLIKELHAQAKCTFSFDATRIQANAELIITGKDNTVAAVLRKLESDLQISFVRINDHLVLKPAPPSRLPTALKGSPRKAPVVTAVRTPEEKMDANKETGQPENLTVTGMQQIGDPVVSQPAVDRRDSIPPYDPANVVQQKKTEANELQKETPVDQVVLADTTSSQKPAKKTPPPKATRNYILRSGLTGDEVIYSGIVVQGGLPAVHGWIGYRSNFSVSFFTYGLGSSWKMTGTWRMGIAVMNASGVRQQGAFRQDSVSGTRTVSGVSRLSRVNVYAEKQISQRITLQVGLLYNLLSTTYAVNGATSSIDFVGAHADHTVSGISPLYTITNSFHKGATQSAQTWVGGQVSLLWKFAR